METFDFSQPNGPQVKASRFTTPGGATEIHICIMPGEPASFPQQLAAVESSYRQALTELRLAENSVILRRIFLSDTANQEKLLAASVLSRRDAENPAAISIIEQPPLPDGKIALWAYHLQDGEHPPRKEMRPGGVLVQRRDKSHLWTTDLPPVATLASANPTTQTREIFANYIKELAVHQAELADHVVRTWIFVDSVDLNYGDMVRERCELFDRHDLTAQTHYIASTGIAGRRADHRHLVTIEGYAIPGLKPEQIHYLTAPEMLGPTSAYGVTFERGTMIDHGDRNHLFISGTASINNKGEVLHLGNIQAQTERTFTNIEGLLKDGNATLNDIAQMIVYLRDPSDRIPVTSYLETHFPNTPYTLVKAPVCRPTWLIEVECLAISRGTCSDPGNAL